TRAKEQEGLRMRAQVPARGIGVLVGLQATVNPLNGSETYRSFGDVPVGRLAELLDDSTLREKILGEIGPLSFLERVFELGDPPNYEPSPDQSVVARAGRIGVDPKELMYDLMLGDGGEALLYFPILNYFDGNLDAAA